MPTQKRVPLGATGELVATNVKRLRGSMQYKELAEKLAAIDRPIPALGLRRIEAGERRVDVDDLVALAIVFGVSPLTLLLPRDGSADISSRMTGSNRAIAHNVQWLWGTGDEPLLIPSDVREEEQKRHKALFSTAAKPPIDERGTPIAEFRVDGESEVEFDDRLMRKMMQHLIDQGIVTQAMIANNARPQPVETNNLESAGAPFTIPVGIVQVEDGSYRISVDGETVEGEVYSTRAAAKHAIANMHEQHEDFIAQQQPTKVNSRHGND